MRLIDADALIVEIKTCLWDWESVNGIKAKTVLNQTITDIGNMPTIDAVQIVRCEDCKYFHYSKPHGILIMNLVCDKWGKGCRTVPDGYCFMGERKDSDV